MVEILASIVKVILNLINTVYSVFSILYSCVAWLPNEIKYIFISILTIVLAIALYKLIK